MKSKKSLGIASILILILFIMLPATANAEPLSEALAGSLAKINDFFEQEQYKAYAKTIDFFFFALLFISVYLVGVRYAFKEVNKPEKLIALVLGLMSAFLMVSNDYSVTKLLPYVPWLLYAFLFTMFWLLFKGVKSKFWRFALALFLTLIIIVLMEGLIDLTGNGQISESFGMLILFKNGNNK